MMSALSASLAVLLMAGLAAGQLSFQIQALPGDCTKFQIINPIFRGLTIPCQRGRVFSAARTACVPVTDPANDQCPQARTLDEVSNLCAGCPTCVYPHFEKCNKFYNCTRTARALLDVLAPLEDECPYPQLFDKITLRCRHYTEVNCDSREVTKYQCDYERNTCRTAHCRPCSVTYADCRDLPDGFQAWQGRSWSPYYAVCQDGRSVESAICTSARDGSPRIFSPISRNCEDLANIPRQFGGQA